ncbi:hypothetical protein QE393_002328 [Pseudomonas sp. SORGH_AS 211]|uniref:hypothetical protein n=1 Tax=Pseudomonas sp. SORGH_AS_0211 TaxID=3041796 RepID=UPI002867370E|nr:hypothetical protein [Pseudomonas sp. SORGH_AS_0211]MDR6179068.1 hypothetical protein [Pseudomonas sp. SORGH_AS_0211]
MNKDGSETSAGYLLLGYVDARLLALYQAGVVPRLELARTPAALTATGQADGAVVPLYIQQDAAHDVLPSSGPCEFAEAAGANEPPSIPSLDGLACPVAEDRAADAGWHSSSVLERQLELPDEDVEDYSLEERLEATRLALAELEAGDEVNVPLLRQVPVK